MQSLTCINLITQFYTCNLLLVCFYLIPTCLIGNPRNALSMTERVPTDEWGGGEQTPPKNLDKPKKRVHKNLNRGVWGGGCSMP